MNKKSILIVIIGWVSAGLILGGGFLYIFNPLAGLAFLTLVMIGITVFIMPIAHIVIMQNQLKKGTYSPGKVVISLMGVLILSFFVLAFTGAFNFT